MIPDLNPAQGLLKRLRAEGIGGLMQPAPTREEVLAGLLREARGEAPGTSSAARVTAWRLIGEHLGMWQPEKEERGKSGLEKLAEHFAALREQRERDRGRDQE